MSRHPSKAAANAAGAGAPTGLIEAGEPPEPFALLDYEGNLRADANPALVPKISDADCLRLYRELLKVRLVDERMMKLQRQGRLGFYMQSIGEEATHFGVAYALRATDWVFPSYREPGVAFWRGYSLRDFTNQLFGNAEDPVKGRQMPVHHSFRAGNYVSISSPVGTQIPQAVGVARAARSWPVARCGGSWRGSRPPLRATLGCPSRRTARRPRRTPTASAARPTSRRPASPSAV